MVGALDRSEIMLVEPHVESPTGVKITDRDMRAFEKPRLRRHDFHGDWNYTIRPHTTLNDQPEQDRDVDSR
ncbi:hypothetical protein [Nonomuraea sp. 10N515B]|uniref:hypothetical protein n=1 Tax=Nonomuraea sp. 10N515B TaxID=3457422 RepID=UPI003FCDF9AB